MKTQTSLTLTLCALATAALTACGGGGSSSETPTPAPTIKSVAAENLAAIGGAPIASDTGTESFDVLASIGDTWRLTVNKSTGAYTLTPNNSQYGLTAESGTLTRSESGDVVTYSLANKISLTQDTRTGTLTGTMTVGSQTANVSGTPYQVANASKLAGIYTFMGTAKNRSNGQYADFMAGQLQVSADGTTMTICVGGKVNASGNCDQVDPSGTTPEKGVLTMTKVTGNNGGFYHLTSASNNVQQEFGNLMVGVGDLGAVLLIDRFGLNQDGVSRVGNFYAIKSQTLNGTEFDGTWKCGTSNGTATVVASHTTATITNPNETPSTWVEALTYNKVNANDNSKLNFPGFMTSEVSGSTDSAVLLLPLSASMAVVENQSTKGIGICSK